MAGLPNPQLARQWGERLDRFEHSDSTVENFCEFRRDGERSYRQLQGSSGRRLSAMRPRKRFDLSWPVVDR
ncbi:hypothetical protein TBK1r_48260 [Stieleria magnilauensis]|uniref:Uncharacterized protein n=1 Tax=Stieleria magnilauensis TaxID=2527963 RepID=A0ABX5XXZ3_9BACT|nr:hypothetical protein TBK1r_48260 [Planctomycetes bacterium TBK1r]